MKDGVRSQAADTLTAFEVSGRVQGVGFRWAAQQQANQLDLSGWIRNRSDLRVEGEVSGEADAVAVFLRWLAKGPAGAMVEKVETGTIPATQSRRDGQAGSFVIRR